MIKSRDWPGATNLLGRTCHDSHGVDLCVRVSLCHVYVHCQAEITGISCDTYTSAMIDLSHTEGVCIIDALEGIAYSWRSSRFMMHMLTRGVQA